MEGGRKIRELVECKSQMTRESGRGVGAEEGRADVLRCWSREVLSNEIYNSQRGSWLHSCRLRRERREFEARLNHKVCSRPVSATQVLFAERRKKEKDCSRTVGRSPSVERDLLSSPEPPEMRSGQSGEGDI